MEYEKGSIAYRPAGVDMARIVPSGKSELKRLIIDVRTVAE
jgi:hypothetical protein